MATNLVRKLYGRVRSAYRSGVAATGAVRSLVPQPSTTPSTKDKPVRAEVEKSVRAQIVRPKKTAKPKAAKKPRTVYKSPRKKAPLPSNASAPSPTNSPF
jgi:hypothetical protein